MYVKFTDINSTIYTLLIEDGWAIVYTDKLGQVLESHVWSIVDTVGLALGNCAASNLRAELRLHGVGFHKN